MACLVSETTPKLRFRAHTETVPSDSNFYMKVHKSQFEQNEKIGVVVIISVVVVVV